MQGVNLSLDGSNSGEFVTTFSLKYHHYEFMYISDVQNPAVEAYVRAITFVSRERWNSPGAMTGPTIAKILEERWNEMH